MYLNAPKLSLLSAMLVASIGAVCMPSESQAGETTLNAVIQPSIYSSPMGYRRLVKQARDDGRIVRTLDDSAKPANLVDSFPLLAFGHMSDTQICDDQSPARVTFMDQRYDRDHAWDTGSAYRPQERLSTQLATAMVSSLRNVDKAPQTGLPLGFTLITGDMVDNSQFNETRMYINLMDGGLIRPRNRSAFTEEGPGYGGNDINYWTYLPGHFWGSAYYHPDGATNGTGQIDWYRQHDFPLVPHLLSASRMDFVSPGLGMPWYAAFGNHDMSIQGNLPPGNYNYWWGDVGDWLADRSLDDDRLINLVGIEEYEHSNLGWAEAVLDGAGFRWTSASPSANRWMLDKTEFMEEHFATTGLPVGHGFDGKPCYVMPSSGPNDRFKFIALDTTNRYDFGSGGWIDNTQWNWLVEELKAASSSWWEYGVAGTEPRRVVNPDPAAKNKLIVLYGHHTLNSLNKVTEDSTGPLGKNGAQLAQLMRRFPNVIMYVNGHTHKNSILPYPASHTLKERIQEWVLGSDVARGPRLPGAEPPKEGLNKSP